MAKRTAAQPAKAGVKSTAKKLATSRHGFEQHPASRKTPGAFAKEENARVRLDPARGATTPARRAALPKMKKSG